MPQKLGKISVGSSGFSRHHFDMEHSVETTFDFGVVQPLMCKLLDAGDKASLDVSNILRATPLVSPVMGKISLDIFHTFVKLHDLTKNYAAFRTRSVVRRASGTFVPQKLPHISLGLLSQMVLCGAKATIYKGADGASSNTLYLYDAYTDDTHTTLTDDAQSLVSTLMRDFTKPNGDVNTISSPLIKANQATAFNTTAFPYALNFTLLSYLMGNSSRSSYLAEHNGIKISSNPWIPLSNDSVGSFFDNYYTNPSSVPSTSYQREVVSLDSADILIPFNQLIGEDDGETISNNVWIAFRLSSFGRQIRSILLGLGYQINLYSTKQVCFYQLIACYKAYFDTYGLGRWTNYEQSNAFWLCDYYDNNNVHEFENDMLYKSIGSTTFFDAIWKFFFDLASLYATDSMDYVSAHVVNLANTPSTDLESTHVAASAIDVSNQSSSDSTIPSPQPLPISQATTGGATGTSFGHAFINAVQHGEVTNMFLKALYRVTNRDSVAGKFLAKLMKARGLEKYISECESTFIGHTSSDLPIHDVVSTADTYNPTTNQGSVVGEFSGLGVQRRHNKKMVYSADADGYWITLAVVLPYGAYTQGLADEMSAITPEQMYNPDYDGKGMELHTKDAVCANLSVYDVTHKQTADTKPLGFVPRYSGLKTKYSIMNGDFSRRGSRSSYLTYSLNKVIDVGEREFTNPVRDDANGVTMITATRIMTIDNLPNAGNAYRFFSRYPWLNSFNRIFKEFGAYGDAGDIFRSGDYDFYEFLRMDDDRFFGQFVMNLQLDSKKKPIEDCFGTYDDEVGANSKMSLT